MLISDWSSDVCSSDLIAGLRRFDRVMDLGDGSGGDRPVVEAFEQHLHRLAEGGRDGGARYDDAGLRADLANLDGLVAEEIGRASCRGRVSKCVWMWGVCEVLKKKKIHTVGKKR